MTFTEPEQSETAKALTLIRETLAPEDSVSTYKELYEHAVIMHEQKLEKLRKRMEDKHENLYNQRKDALEENVILKRKLAARLGV